MMIPEAEFPQFVEQRQHEMRVLAAACRTRTPTLSLRQRAGRSLIRLGHWVEGRYPDLSIESMPGSMPRSA